MWVCPSCHSLNVEGSSSCCACRLPREAESGTKRAPLWLVGLTTTALVAGALSAGAAVSFGLVVAGIALIVLLLVAAVGHRVLRIGALLALGLVVGVALGRAPWAPPVVYLCLLVGFVAVGTLGGIRGGVGGWAALMIGALVAFGSLIYLRSIPLFGDPVPALIPAGEWRIAFLAAVGGGLACLTGGYWAAWWARTRRGWPETAGPARAGPTRRDVGWVLAPALVAGSILVPFVTVRLSELGDLVIPDSEQVVTVIVTDRQVTLSTTVVHPGVVHFVISERGERADVIQIAGLPRQDDVQWGDTLEDRLEDVANLEASRLPARAPCTTIFFAPQWCEWDELNPPSQEAADRYWGRYVLDAGDKFAWYAVSWPPHLDSRVLVEVQ